MPTNQPPRTALAALLDALDEPMLWWDERGLVGFCNHAAMRLLECEPGQGLDELRPALGEAATLWLQTALVDLTQPHESPALTLPDGRHLTLRAWGAEGGCALRLRVDARIAPPLAVAELPALAAASTQQTLRVLWASPFPAMLTDAQHRLVAANAAYLAFTSRRIELLLGRDPIELEPLEDHDTSLQARAEPAPAPGEGRLREMRVVDGHGRERWARSVEYVVLGPEGQLRRLAVLQDSTGEHVARAQAERSLNELAQWFDLSPTGMLVFDASGLIVRSNPAFEAQVGQVPVLINDAAAELQSLLGWHRGQPLPSLQPGMAPLETHVSMPLPDGRRHRLSARVRGFATEAGQLRFMAVVADRSAEEERDLAQLEIGALMDTAGVGVATFDTARGWLRRPPGRRAAQSAAGPSLHAISRELVEPGSLLEYERLQQALRRGERAEVRYAVRHAELGPRWLLTRVEPAPPGAGRRTLSVVTLDVTEQEGALRRNEQLLRELTTILDSTSAGIAYLRGPLLLRCNSRFERMLGLAAGAAAGATLNELFRQLPPAQGVVAQVQAALAAGQGFESEINVRPATAQQPALWYSISVRRAEASPDESEAVAVLTDISRLKSQQAELEALLRDRELMFSLSDVGIVFVRAGRIERANQAMAAITGYAGPELAALDLADLSESADEHLRTEFEAQSVLRQHGRFQGERRLRRRDGSLLWVQVAQRLVDDVAPEAGSIISFVNVDERYRARQSLVRQAERTRAILDSVLVGIVTVGEGGIEWMNRSARRMFAGELADFVGEPISTVATPEADHPLRRTHYLHTLDEGEAQTFECLLQARDGREFWVVGNAVVTARESTGRQITFALLDIESRRQAELSQTQARASLQRIIETAPLAIALFDAGSGRVLQLNQMAALYFGRHIDQLMGRTPQEWASPQQATELQADLDTARRAAGVQHREVVHETVPETADGGDAGEVNKRHWDVRLVSLLAAGGAASQVLLVASDVTGQRAAEQARLQAAIAQREMLVKEVHHRIKNNLQGVAGLLQQNAARHPEVAGVLSESVGQVQAIAQVYGLQVGVGGPLKVASVLEAIAQSVQRTFGREISVGYGEAGAPGHVLPEAESIPIALTLNELLTNAVKHGHGAVRCELGVAGAEVRLHIINPGLLPEGFDLAQYPFGVSGLGLVRALLPRRSATLMLRQEDAEVWARVVLRPPSVSPG